MSDERRKDHEPESPIPTNIPDRPEDPKPVEDEIPQPPAGGPVG